MSIIDKALKANHAFAKKYDRKLGAHPAPKIAVVTCMDPRLSDLPGILGLPQADIDVIRTGGPAVTEDVLGELVVSTRVSDRGKSCFSTTRAADSRPSQTMSYNAKLSASTGDASPAPMRFFSYKDPEENTREQIKKVRSHPWIAKEVPVRGFIFDVETGPHHRSGAGCTGRCRLKDDGVLIREARRRKRNFVCPAALRVCFNEIDDETEVLHESC